VHFTADAELRELIERARALASHRLPNGDLAGLMKLMAANFVRQEEKRRFGIGVRSRRVKTETETETNAERVHVAPPRTPPGGVSVSGVLTETKAHEGRALRAGKRGRYLPVTVRREAYTRDDGRCAFVSAAGRRCSARAFLELDHIDLLPGSVAQARGIFGCCADRIIFCTPDTALGKCTSRPRLRKESVPRLRLGPRQNDASTRVQHGKAIGGGGVAPRQTFRGLSSVAGQSATHSRHWVRGKRGSADPELQAPSIPDESSAAAGPVAAPRSSAPPVAASHCRPCRLSPWFVYEVSLRTVGLVGSAHSSCTKYRFALSALSAQPIVRVRSIASHCRPCRLSP